MVCEYVKQLFAEDKARDVTLEVNSAMLLSCCLRWYLVLISD